MKKTFLSLILTIFMISLTVASVRADIPNLINFQGRVTDTAGTPLNGEYSITFRIYDAATGGAMWWDETQSAVTVNNGIFSILLGSVTSLNIAFDIPYWISMEVNNDGEMTPRQAITSVGYSFHAKTADSARTATTATPINDMDLVNKKYVDDNIGKRIEVFTEDGIFIAPEGVTTVYLTMVGGGGGGEAENRQTPAGGGGAGGTYINYPFTVIEGNSYLVTIGTGGAGGSGSYGADGANGGATSFDSVSIPGGQGGGVRGDGLGGYGGLLTRDAKQSIGGKSGMSSGNGANGVQNIYHGGRGASIFGNGGNAGNPGVAGSLYGGGGGAGGPGSPMASGGAGANGICIVMY